MMMMIMMNESSFFFRCMNESEASEWSKATTGFHTFWCMNYSNYLCSSSYLLQWQSIGCGAVTCCAMLCYAMLYYTMLYFVVLCYVMLCCVVLCCAVLCCVVLCCVVLCCVDLCCGREYISIWFHHWYKSKSYTSDIRISGSRFLALEATYGIINIILMWYIYSPCHVPVVVVVVVVVVRVGVGVIVVLYNTRTQYFSEYEWMVVQTGSCAVLPGCHDISSMGSSLSL